MHAHTYTHISLAYNYVVSGFIITDTLSVTLVRLKVLGPKLRLKSQTRNKDRCALIIIYCLAKRPHKSCGCYWCGCSPGWYMRGVAGFACCLHAIVAYAYINEHARTHTHTHTYVGWPNCSRHSRFLTRTVMGKLTCTSCVAGCSVVGILASCPRQHCL